MKHFTTIAVLAVVLMTLPAISSAQDTTSTVSGKGYYYEGSVTFPTFALVTVSLGVETIHGVRFENSDFFIGGMAGTQLTIPFGFSAYVGVIPRIYYPKKKKVDPYVSMGLGYMYYEDGFGYDVYQGPDNVFLAPEFGWGFRGKKGNFFDMSVKLFVVMGTDDLFHISPKGYEFDWMIFPNFSIGIRF